MGLCSALSGEAAGTATNAYGHTSALSAAGGETQTTIDGEDASEAATLAAPASPAAPEDPVLPTDLIRPAGLKKLGLAKPGSMSIEEVSGDVTPIDVLAGGRK